MKKRIRPRKTERKYEMLGHTKAKEIALSDIREDLEFGSRYTGILMYSLEEQLKCFNNVSVCSIDDLADEVDSSKVFGTEIFVGYEVLSTRYDVWINEGFITLATSNLDRKNLLLKYGKRIDSRIEQMFNVVVLDGIDLRKK